MDKQLSNKKGLIPLYNPDNQDFTSQYDIHGNKKPVIYTIPSQEIKYFEPAVAEHIKKHLANQLINKRGIKTNHEDEYSAILKEIEVVL